jgi:hypothetical protein
MWYLAGLALACLIGATQGCAQEGSNRAQGGAMNTSFTIPSEWEYTAPLLGPEARTTDRSCAQKDPSIVFFGGKWHVFMTIKCGQTTPMEYCSFADWKEADHAPRTVLKVADSKYYCAPQVFYFRPQEKWYMVYQVGVPGQKRMWVAYSTTTQIDDPSSWTRAQPILSGDDQDPRPEGGLDYWIICDDQRAYLFYTTNNGKMWRMWTRLEDFPRGFRDPQIALQGDIFEASHTYSLTGTNKYLTIIEANPGGRRYYKAYLADRLDGRWEPLADTAEKPFAGWSNVRPAAGVASWTDNLSHGELVREGNDETMPVDPQHLCMVFQGMLESEKAGKGYGQFPWRLGLLTPAAKGP